MKKKKTKARGRNKFRGNTYKVVTLKRNKDLSRRVTKRQKKTAEQEKRKLKNLIRKKEKEERKKFLVEISKLHKKSDIKSTITNHEIILSFMQKKLPFDTIELILKERDKYNIIREIFENFEFEKKLNDLDNLKKLLEDIKLIDENFVNDYIDLGELKNNIEEFKNNLKEFDDAFKERNIEKLEEMLNNKDQQEDLLNEIMDKISELNGSVEEMLNNEDDRIAVEIFNVIKEFYENFYGKKYEDNY